LELLKDTARLWSRNLGRDDRCVSDHGREARHPYLDENVIQLLYALPVHLICDLGLTSSSSASSSLSSSPSLQLQQPQGWGDKRLLRMAAARLGLGRSASLVKRAMQFGARIANKEVVGTVRLGADVKLSEIVHPRAVGEPEIASSSTLSSSSSLSASASSSTTASSSSMSSSSSGLSARISKKVAHAAKAAAAATGRIPDQS
jgi:hypothetical protein